MNNEYSIVSAKYVSSDNSCIEFIIKLNDQDIEIPYGYIVNSDDNAPITLWLNEQIKNGNVHPDPYIESDEYNDSMVELIRSERTKLLSDTDYLVNADYPISDEDRSLLRQYRQELRDITKQSGFPKNVVWPEKPSFLNK